MPIDQSICTKTIEYKKAIAAVRNTVCTKVSSSFLAANEISFIFPWIEAAVCSSRYKYFFENIPSSSSSLDSLRSVCIRKLLKQSAIAGIMIDNASKKTLSVLIEPFLDVSNDWSSIG